MPQVSVMRTSQTVAILAMHPIDNEFNTILFAGIHELSKKEYARMEHRKRFTRLYRRHAQYAPNDIECIQLW